ncbi:unnamed protein product [Rhizophagus irregularis]|nr:unnamed protein product [Rhizophagus irregularis]
MRTKILVYSSNITLNHHFSILNSMFNTFYDVIQIDLNNLLNDPWFDTTSCLIFLSSNNNLNCLNNLNYNQKSVQFEKNFKDYLKFGGNYFGIGFDACQFLQKNLSSQFQNDIFNYKNLILNDQNDKIELPLKLNRKFLLNYFPSVPNQIKIPCDNNAIGYFDNLINNNIINSVSTYNDCSTIIQYNIDKGKILLCGFDPFLNNIHIEQNHFIRSLFSIFGLNLVKQNEILIPKLSYTLHLTSIRPALTSILLNNINNLMDSDNIIRASNDSFKIIENSNSFHNNQDLYTNVDYNNNIDIPKSIVIYHDQPPPSSITPFFNFKDFLNHLSEERNIKHGGGNNMEFGSTVLYGEVVSSTQTLLDKNFKFTKNLPTGLVFVATQQIQGRGRGGNSWISPPGCLQFSIILRHPSNSSSPVVFIQYLLSLAVVEAVRTKKGYEDIPLRLKWPNDIYVESSSPNDESVKSPEIIKIGGVIVNSQYTQDELDEFLLIAGCGVNVSNLAPTTAINHIISLYNHANNTQLEEFSQEQLLAAILVKFESFYSNFCRNGYGFEPFLDIYYERWLHTDQVVNLETHDNQKAHIIGINEFGYLKASTISDGVNLEEIITLEPGGNSFDMMKGMITRKL